MGWRGVCRPPIPGSSIGPTLLVRVGAADLDTPEPHQLDLMRIVSHVVEPTGALKTGISLYGVQYLSFLSSESRSKLRTGILHTDE
jgi:hypothetical protein